MAQQGDSPIVLPRRVISSARTQTPYSRYESGEAIRRDDVVNPNQDSRAFRQVQNASATMRALFESNDLVSTAISNFLAMGQTGLRVAAYDRATHEFSRPGLFAAEHVLSLLATDWDYTKGYQDRRGLHGLIETMRLEVLLTGGVGVELVLDTSRYPMDLVIFPYDSVTFVSKGKGRKYPTQRSSDRGEISLDLPTVFIGESLKTAARRYTLPVMHSGVKRVHHFESFFDDAWRVIRRAGMSRLVVTLDYEKVVLSAPKDVQSDPTKLASYLEQVRISHEDALRGIEPEDALVCYNTAEIEALKTYGEKAEISELIERLSGLTASALKSNPSMLGLRIGGSQNTATAEAMLSAKTAELLNGPVVDVLSRALTLAVRLYGIDARVKVGFDAIDLRPELELQAHKAILQNSVLELLSLGRITDDEAQAMLSLGSLPADAQELSGTRFLEVRPMDALPAAATNSRNRQITPNTPKAAGGKDNEQR